MTKKEVEEYATENEVEIMLFDDFENCIVGLSTDDRAIYSLAMMTVYLNDRDGMEFEQAFEYITYNTLRALEYIPSDRRPVVWDDL